MAQRALLLRLGFANAQATAIIDQGIETPSDLDTMTHSDLKAFFKNLTSAGTITPFMAQHRMQILRYWVEKRLPLELPVNAALFTMVVCNEWARKMKAATDDAADKEKVTIPAPPKWKKGGSMDWRPWKEQFVTYIGAKLGQNKAPLTYVLRPEDAPAADGIYDDDYDRMVFMMPLTGDRYKKDNGAVYDELKALMVDSQAWTWIRPYDRSRNGRAAWKALIEHYEGTTEQNRIKAAAYASIK
jgi:hypothetical protein